jgi:D-tyrosyl-tRNA(Tyr) deacylase
MKAMVQRVQWAEVEVEGDGGVVGRISHGLLVYLAVSPGDSLKDARDLAEKIANLRIFEDVGGKMNRTVQDVRGDILAISNFTLLADARKGRRPAFTGAAPAQQAKPLHEEFVAALRTLTGPVETGLFGASMTVRSAADGPVNIILDMPPLADPSAAAPPSTYVGWAANHETANQDIVKRDTATQDTSPLQEAREDEINL